MLPREANLGLVAAFSVRGRLTPQIVESVISQIVERHEILRTTISTIDGTPVQVVGEPYSFSLPVRESSQQSIPNSEKAIQDRARALLQIPFDLSAGPLFRVELLKTGFEEHTLILVAHHIVFDGWSLRVLGREILRLLQTSLQGLPSPLPELPIQYKDFACRQRLELSKPVMERLLSYWTPQLKGVRVLEVPGDLPRPRERTFGGENHYFSASPELRKKLLDLSRRQGLTPFMTLLAAFKTLLMIYSGETDIAVRTPFAGRDQPDLEDLIGFFVNTLVLRTDLSGNPSFSRLTQRVQRVVLEGLEHRALPFEQLLRSTSGAWTDLSRPPLAQIGFFVDRPSQAAGSVKGLSVEIPLIGSGTATLDLTLLAWLGEDLDFCLEYNTSLYSPAFVRSLGESWLRVLDLTLRHPERKIEDLCLLKEAEAQEIQSQWSAPRRFRNAQAGVHQLFEEQAARTPHSLALQSDGTAWSFQELNQRANRLAHWLSAQGIGPDQLVGLRLPPNEQLVSAMLAVLKAGAGYLPLDPTLPKMRLLEMVSQADPQLILTHSDWPALSLPVDKTMGRNCCGSFLLDHLAPELEKADDSNPDWKNPADSLAYVLFTSGSTGTPKGVEIPHRALTNHMLWMRRAFPMTAADRILQRTPISFDASIWEFFAPLISGACLVLPPLETSLDMSALVLTLREQRITHLQIVPTLLKILLDSGELGRCRHLRFVFSGGETLTSQLQKDFFEQCQAQLVNLYGPAEACIDASFHLCRPDEAGSDAPLGEPIDNSRFLVLSNSRQLLPPGVVGELFIGGKGVARGYRNRPEETALRFLPDPTRPGAKTIYRTGDRVRISLQGKLEFHGRTDFQIKINGARVETGEIEARLLTHPAVKSTVVQLQEGETPDPVLTAYVVTKGLEAPSAAEFRDYLRPTIPDYMIPRSFTNLTAIPLTTAGKLDHCSLPPPTLGDQADKVPFKGPGNEMEQILHESWCAVLGAREIGIHDNFFDAGGASLQSIQLAAQIRRRGYLLAPAQIFEFTTIAEQARVIEVVPEGELVENQLPDELAGQIASRRRTSATSKNERGATTVIESLGVYLPPREVTTREIIEGCRHKLKLPLERLTGIRSRRMAGEDEFSIDLAQAAVTTCLKRSRYAARDIDLVVSCNISRYDQPRSFSFEPGTAVKLKKLLGFERAMTLDISNACAGFFTGIFLADQLIRGGVLQRCLIVSGEYITHLTRTAQMEIAELLDTRLACLTLGDAGAAVILEASRDQESGFRALELYTVGSLSSLCIAKVAEQQDHGLAIMHTDMLKVSATATRQTMLHAARILGEKDWELEDFDHLIAHQTSRNALRGASREINRVLGREACHDDNVVDNLSSRGNTATTSHMVAIWDGIHSGRVKTGDRALFNISGSGQTIGTGIYQFDDLPARLRRPASHSKPVAATPMGSLGVMTCGHQPVRIESHGTLPAELDFKRDAIWLAQMGAENCLSKSRYGPGEIDTLMHCGVYRNDFLSEPAIAAFLAGRLGINSEVESPDSPTSFAFDVFNGALGFLNSCFLASVLIQNGSSRTALVTASEVENNAFTEEKPLLGLKETGSAVLLDRCPEGRSGFQAFLFRAFPQFSESFCSRLTVENGEPYLFFEKSDDYDEACLHHIQLTVGELLSHSQLETSSISWVIPPLISTSFRRELSLRLSIPERRFAAVGSEEKDYASSSLAYGFDWAINRAKAKPGETGLVIGVAAGIQVGCALYTF